MGGLFRQSTRLVIFDSVGQYHPHLLHAVVCEQPGQVKQLLRAHLQAPIRILYQPKGEIKRHFAAVTALVIACGSLVYAIDEVDRYCEPNWMPPGLDFLVNCGRHRKISMLCTSRRPAQVARELTSQAREFRIFRMTEPADLRYLENYIGQAAARELPRLGLYEYLVWDEGREGYHIEGGRR